SCAIELPLQELLGPKTLGELAHDLERARTATSTSITAFRPSPRTDGPIPASFSQERVWFLERMSPSNVAYNASAKLTFSGSLDVQALRRALGEIVERHEIYRTRFVDIEGQLVQVIEAPAMFALPDLITVQTPKEVEAIFFEASRAPFNLAHLPLVR